MKVQINAPTKELVELTDQNDNIIGTVELNLGDINVIERFNNAYPLIINTIKNADFSGGEIGSTVNKIKEMEKEICNLIDGIFDCEGLTEACSQGSSVFDFDSSGTMRCESIIEMFLNLYTDKIQESLKERQNKIKSQKNVAKYV